MTRFALTIDPDNDRLKARSTEIEALHAENAFTIPTTMGLEKETNPFLRAADPAIRRHLGMETRSNEEVFAEIRKRKAADYQAQRRSIFELYIEEVANAIGKIKGVKPGPIKKEFLQVAHKVTAAEMKDEEKALELEMREAKTKAKARARAEAEED